VSLPGNVKSIGSISLPSSVIITSNIASAASLLSIVIKLSLLILSIYTLQQTFEYKSILRSLNMMVWIWSVIIIEASLGVASTLYMGLYPASASTVPDIPDLEYGNRDNLAF